MVTAAVQDEVASAVVVVVAAADHRMAKVKGSNFMCTVMTT